MKITGKTKILGIFGFPVSHSLSPVMQNAAIDALGLDYVYIPFEVEPAQLESAVKGICALGIAGINVTVPHKESIIQFLDEITAEAELTGAVNTVENRNGRLIGHNTDGRGYIRSLREDAAFEPSNKRILIIGAGGAARGIIAALSLEGVSKITIANRTVERAGILVNDFSGKFGNTDFRYGPLSLLKDPEILPEVDLIVNTTSMALEGDAPDIDFSATRKDVVISDIAYKPPLTLFMKKAREANRKVIGGIGMLIHQGAISFEIWTSQKPPIKIMKEALSEYI